MRHGHWWGAHSSLAVDLRLVLLDKLWVLGTQPQTGYWEACVTGNFLHLGLAQQIQGITASTHEDELSLDYRDVTGVLVLGIDLPGRAIALDVDDLMSVADLGAGGLSRGQELLGQRAEVNVSAGIGPGDGYLIGEITALRHQGQLLRKDRIISGELHAWEHVLLAQNVIATLKVVNLDFALCEGHVRNRVNKFARVGKNTVVELVRPELARLLELLINPQSLGDINATILLRGVVQLAQCGVAGAGVIPRGGGLQCGAVETLKDHLGPARLQLAEHCAQGGAHDAGTNKCYVDLVYNLCCLLSGGHSVITSSN